MGFATGAVHRQPGADAELQDRMRELCRIDGGFGGDDDVTHQDKALMICMYYINHQIQSKIQSESKKRELEEFQDNNCQTRMLQIILSHIRHNTSIGKIINNITI